MGGAANLKPHDDAWIVGKGQDSLAPAEPVIEAMDGRAEDIH
jgi:hypothetical protein